jgi:hypothetical protein
MTENIKSHIQHHYRSNVSLMLEGFNYLLNHTLFVYQITS